MTERERYRTRGYYYRLTGDYRTCVKEYSDLVARYAADASAHNQIAVCSSYLRDLTRSVEEMRQAARILPNRALYRQNLATFLNHMGDFQAAEQEARALSEPGVFGLIAIAMAQTAQGQTPQAIETYQKLGATTAQGKSYAASGLGDVAVYEGRFSDAIGILTEAAKADLAAQDPDRAAAKFAAVAYARLHVRQKSAAIAAAENALANSKLVKIRFLAARIFVEAGESAKARTLTAGLASEPQNAEAQAYAKIIDGMSVLKQGDTRQAIGALTEANALVDTWIGRFELGRAYFEARAYLQADSEFDRCLKRRGEALALFLDDEPTYGYLPLVYHYQGRVREALGTAGFAESYRSYINIREKSREDPLLPEVRRRAGV